MPFSLQNGMTNKMKDNRKAALRQDKVTTASNPEKQNKTPKQLSSRPRLSLPNSSLHSDYFAKKKKSGGWSSQLWTQFMQLCKEAWLLHNWPAPNVSGFIARLVLASHRYLEVTGSNPVEVLNFFRLLYAIAYYCIHNCGCQSLFDFISTVKIWFTSCTSHTLLSGEQHQWLHSSVG